MLGLMLDLFRGSVPGPVAVATTITTAVSTATGRSRFFSCRGLAFATSMTLDTMHSVLNGSQCNADGSCIMFKSLKHFQVIEWFDQLAQVLQLVLLLLQSTCRLYFVKGVLMKIPFDLPDVVVDIG